VRKRLGVRKRRGVRKRLGMRKRLNALKCEEEGRKKLNAFRRG
jgi:hypothetical protein